MQSETRINTGNINEVSSLTVDESVEVAILIDKRKSIPVFSLTLEIN